MQSVRQEAVCTLGGQDDSTSHPQPPRGPSHAKRLIYCRLRNHSVEFAVMSASAAASVSKKRTVDDVDQTSAVNSSKKIKVRMFFVHVTVSENFGLLLSSVCYHTARIVLKMRQLTLDIFVFSLYSVSSF
jgi:hypothetical protein